MKIQKLFFCVALLFAAFTGTAQFSKDTILSANAAFNNPTHHLDTREIFQRKGKIFFYWGYNRSAYTNSDIRFSGDGYDFRIKNITAKDQPEKLSSVYVSPTSFTVPEYDYRLGYYINEKTFISLGEDHMKYSIDKQTTHLTGTVSKDNNNGKNIGGYSDQEVLVGEGSENPGNVPSIIDSLQQGFVSGFEHCDGLNDVSLELGRIEQLWIAKNAKHAFAVVGTVAVGMVVPDTDADVLGYAPKHDMEIGKKSYHLAGYSFSASIGLEFNFYKNFFLQTRLKGGYMNLPDINTTVEGGKASQHFSFMEPMLVAGYSHSFGKH